MVATIPSWITMIVKQDELDIAPKDGPSSRPPQSTSAEYSRRSRGAADSAHRAEGTNDEP